MPVINALCEYKKVGSLSIKCSVQCSPTPLAPVIVYIHGGALISGDRKGISKPLHRALLKTGFSLISIDYRLAPETKLDQIILDVEDALKWVRGEGAQIFRWDASRMGVTGGSAGGYLTLMTGTFAQKPKALVPFYGYGDLLGEWYVKPDPFYNKMDKISEEDAFAALKGKEHTSANGGKFYLYTRQQGTWVNEVSGWNPQTQRELILPYCPEFNVKADYPPTLLIHGDDDTDVPYAQSVQMHAALQKAGVHSELHTLPGFPHAFDFFMQKDAATIEAIARAAAFFKKWL